ncbi:hypothetical protein XBI1_940006 [Xenorhabdus bovienii str. Intermedium]|uniref:Uncharacterized protein n=1 Tax=Xenorhabdus bovienii str. Intermedium TaxID=1379677 RepID=A0A077QPH1_XENBV|nr:hypothetical protein XBI1_940006 [Xenorhabdus bovienii str. Intermedium]
MSFSCIVFFFKNYDYCYEEHVIHLLDESRILIDLLKKSSSMCYSAKIGLTYHLG